MSTSSFRYIYGPVFSRRLGLSLGVDLVPFKTCTYDCIYCQLGRTTHKTAERHEYVPMGKVLAELEQKLADGPVPDYVTLSGSGEPTLNERIGQLIKEIKKLTYIPVAVLTNGSLLWRREVQDALMEADLVLPSLDAGDDFLFHYVNRPHREITFDRMISGLAEFTRRFPKPVWLEVFLLAGVTGFLSEVEKIAALARRIQPQRVQLNTVARPPSEEFARAVSWTQMNEFANLFDAQAEVIIESESDKSESFILFPDMLSGFVSRPLSLQSFLAHYLSKISIETNFHEEWFGMNTCQSRQCDRSNAKHTHQERDDESRLEEQLRHIRHKLLVMSGKGGVGKTSVAVYLALGLAKRGYQVGLLDVDLHGPDVPRILGISGRFEMDDQGYLIPHRYSDHLQVVSIECLLHDRDEAVIWRGPLKHKYIRQSIAQVHWGELDFLIIDSPPGTGDEPLSVAQTITGVQAVIVTTPQEISLADVRKAINFCRKVKMPILGLVENMSGLVCPHCGGEIRLFSQGGGQKTAALMKVPLLASLPFDLRVVEGGDLGKPLLEAPDDSQFLQALAGLVDKVEERLKHPQENLAEKSAQILLSEETVSAPNTFKVAIPLAEGRLCNHFGHCQQFAVIRVKEGLIDLKELLTPPPHEPGVLPRWLGDLGVNLIFAGGMGQRALSLFAEQGIKVITGSPSQEPETLVQGYLAGTLVSGPNVCDH